MGNPVPRGGALRACLGVLILELIAGHIQVPDHPTAGPQQLLGLSFPLLEEAWDPSSLLMYGCDPSTEEWKQEHQEFGSAWATE